MKQLFVQAIETLTLPLANSAEANANLISQWLDVQPSLQLEGVLRVVMFAQVCHQQ
jgi:hypothetical protein